MNASDKLKRRLLQGSRLSCQEVRKILEDLGYLIKRQKGSLEQWVKAGRTFTLACHGNDAPHYVLNAIKELLEKPDVKSEEKDEEA